MTTAEVPSVTSLDSVLGQFNQVPTGLRAALVNREEQMVGVMHLAGRQFGLFPQIVAEVLAEVGLGEPKSEVERAMIHANFVNLMEAIRRAQAGEGPMPTP